MGAQIQSGSWADIKNDGATNPIIITQRRRRESEGIEETERNET